MSVYRQRARRYLGMGEPANQSEKPRGLTFLAIGLAWGMLMGIVIPLTTDRDWSPTRFLLWTIAGGALYGSLMYWWSVRQWRAAAPDRADPGSRPS